MNPKELQLVIQAVQKNIRCPRCGRRYGFDDIHIISFSGSVYSLELECLNHAPLLASVAVNGLKMARIITSGAISTNEVIDAYQQISRAKILKDIIG